MQIKLYYFIRHLLTVTFTYLGATVATNNTDVNGWNVSIKILHDPNDVGGHREGGRDTWVEMSASPHVLYTYFSTFAKTFLRTYSVRYSENEVR
jgi:hypothetical protein